MATIQTPVVLRPGQPVEATLPCGDKIVLETGSVDGHAAVVLVAPRGTKLKRKPKDLTSVA